MNDSARTELVSSILGHVARLKRRSFTVAWMRYAVRAAFYALLASALVVALRPELDLGLVVALAAALALLAGFVLALARRPSENAIAKACDDQIGLSDRVSSSLDLMSLEGPMVDALLADTASASARVVPERVFPFRTPREAWWMPLPLALIALALFLPGLLGAKPVEDPALDEVLDVHQRELAALIERERGKQPSEKREELLAKLEELERQLEREKADKKDALADLSKLLEQLKKERAEQEQKKRELEKQLESLKSGDQQKNLAADLKDGAFQDALNKLQEQIDELEKKLADKKELSEEERKEMEQQLAKLRELRAKLMRLQQMQLDLSFLGDAIDFLEDFEGELGDVGEMLAGVKFVKPNCKCGKPGT